MTIKHKKSAIPPNCTAKICITCEIYNKKQGKMHPPLSFCPRHQTLPALGNRGTEHKSNINQNLYDQNSYDHRFRRCFNNEIH